MQRPLSWIALAALLLAPGVRAEEPLSPHRKELAAAVEEYHTLVRRSERGGYTDREYHDLKEARRTARRRVRDLKELILKEEHQKNDYYPEDPYPEHRRDPQTGGPFRGKLPEIREDRPPDKPAGRP